MFVCARHSPESEQIVQQRWEEVEMEKVFLAPTLKMKQFSSNIKRIISFRSHLDCVLFVCSWAHATFFFLHASNFFFISAESELKQLKVRMNVNQRWTWAGEKSHGRVKSFNNDV